jgi:hypothetical protein
MGKTKCPTSGVSQYASLAVPNPSITTGGEKMRRKTERYIESRQPGYYPYYKLQWWNPIMMAWQDIQRRCTTPDAALALIGDIPDIGQGQATRVMEIQERGRRPVVVECSK